MITQESMYLTLLFLF